jgi:hypothetical protein
MSELKVNKVTPRSGTTVTLGDSGDTITIPSGATIDLSSATQTGVGGTNTPNFFVTKSAFQSVPNTTDTKITFDTEDYDTNSAFASSTFTVPTGQGGKYFLSASVGCRNASNIPSVQIFIRKNTSTQIAGNIRTHTYTSGTSQYQTNTVNGCFSLSAGDTIEIYAYQDSGGNLEVNAYATVEDTFFYGFKLIE